MSFLLLLIYYFIWVYCSITFFINLPYLNYQRRDNQFTNNELNFLNLIKLNPQITLEEIAKKLSISKRAMQKIANNLKNKKIISRTGSNRKVYWNISNN